MTPKEYTLSNEGRERAAYRDSLGFWTAGIGHKLPQEQNWEGVFFHDDQIDAWFSTDYAEAVSGATILLVRAFFKTPADTARFSAIVDMVFQMGKTGVGKFHKMLAAYRAEQWDECAEQLLWNVKPVYAGASMTSPGVRTEYHMQTPERAERNARVIRTGELL